MSFTPKPKCLLEEISAGQESIVSVYDRSCAINGCNAVMLAGVDITRVGEDITTDEFAEHIADCDRMYIDEAARNTLNILYNAMATVAFIDK